MPDSRPNLLLLIPDQHRWDFGPWNPQSPLRMPNLANLAARGVQFDQAIVNSPLCAPMRASLASARSYGSCGVTDNGNDYPPELPTFYQQLRGAGYQVCGTGKFDLHKVSGGWGLDGQNSLADWGFTQGIDNEGKWDGYRNYRDTGEAQGPYYKFLVENGLAEAHCQDFERRGRDYSDGRDYGSTFPTTLPDFAYGDNWIGRNTIDILRELPEGQPWFMQVNFTGPHEPQDITSSMWESCQGTEHPGPLASTQHDAEFHNRARQNYGAMLENIDARIGEIIAAIERRGELENTVIIYTSDHGDMLGDHDEWQKSRPWQSAVAVPLIVAGPGVSEGRKSSALIQMFDLAATFIDYAGADPVPDMDARSIRPVLEDPARGHRDVLFSGLRYHGGYTGVSAQHPSDRYIWDLAFDGRFKLVHQHGYGLAPQLFDLESDPAETNDLAASQPERASAMMELIGSETVRNGIAV